MNISPDIEVSETMKSRSLPALDLFAPECYSNPYEMYGLYREREPVHWGLPYVPSLPGTWYLTRYADIVAVLKDDAFSRERAPGMGAAQIHSPVSELTRHWMLMKDGPDHARIRLVIQDTLASYIRDPLPVRISAISHQLFAEFDATAVGTRPFDLIADFAFPLPVAVIAEIMGIPIEMKKQLESWTRSLLPTIDFKKDNDSYDQAVRSAFSFQIG